MPSTPSSPPTTPRRSRASSSSPAGAAISSSSACTAWARRCTRGWARRTGRKIPCRVYAPVGSHQDLLPYLVRRLLENGANTSFVNRILDEAVPIERLVEDPFARLARTEPKRQPRDSAARRSLPAGSGKLPRHRSARSGSARAGSRRSSDRGFDPGFQAGPGIGPGGGSPRTALDPSDRRRAIGTVVEADDAHRGSRRRGGPARFSCLGEHGPRGALPLPRARGGSVRGPCRRS